jgi:hypothetical protein
MARPVGTTRTATVLRMPASRATTSRAPERGWSVRIRDQNVTALALGSPEATPSRKRPNPRPARPVASRFAGATGAVSRRPPIVAAAIASRRVMSLTAASP